MGGWRRIRYQIAVSDWELGMDNVVYRWMMQIGLFLAHWTAVPVNWWLVKTGLKEPCA